MLTPSKKEDENIWNSNAKIRDSARIPPNINWPKNEEFTPELGGEKIKTYIKVNSSLHKQFLFWPTFNLK